MSAKGGGAAGKGGASASSPLARFSEAAYRLMIVLWVGALWAIGYIAAPTLFHVLANDRMLAGRIAGEMFTWVAWLGVGAASYLLVFVALRREAAAFRCSAFWLVLAMLALTVAGHFGIQPILAQLKAESWPREVMEGALRDRFAAWHGVSSVVYLMQSLLGLWLVLVQDRGLR